MKLTSIVAAFGLLNVALAAPAAVPVVDDTTMPSGLPIPTPSGAVPFSTGLPSGLPTPTGFPAPSSIKGHDTNVVRRSFISSFRAPKPHKEPFPAFPTASGSFPHPTGGFPYAF